MSARPYGYLWIVVAFLSGGLIASAIALLWPIKKEKYRVYVLREDKSYCLSSDKQTCVVLPKGTRVYAKGVEGPSHDMGNELLIPLLLSGDEVEKGYTKGEVVVWPPTPYIEK